MQTTLPTLEPATVIASYQATGPEQISLQVGQIVQVRKKSDRGWWEGEVQVSVKIYIDLMKKSASNLKLVGVGLRSQCFSFDEWLVVGYLKSGLVFT